MVTSILDATSQGIVQLLAQ